MLGESRKRRASQLVDRLTGKQPGSSRLLLLGMTRVLAVSYSSQSIERDNAPPHTRQKILGLLQVLSYLYGTALVQDCKSLPDLPHRSTPNPRAKDRYLTSLDKLRVWPTICLRQTGFDRTSWTYITIAVSHPAEVDEPAKPSQDHARPHSPQRGRGTSRHPITGARH